MAPEVFEMRMLVLILAMALLVPSVVMGADGGQPEDRGDQGSQDGAPERSDQGREQADDASGGASAGDQGSGDGSKAEADDGSDDEEGATGEEGPDGEGGADDDGNAGQGQQEESGDASDGEGNPDAGAGEQSRGGRDRAEGRDGNASENARSNRTDGGTDDGNGTRASAGGGSAPEDRDAADPGEEESARENRTAAPDSNERPNGTEEEADEVTDGDEPLAPQSKGEPRRDGQNRSHANGPPEDRAADRRTEGGAGRDGPPEHAAQGSGRPDTTEATDHEQRRRASPGSAPPLALGPTTLGDVAFDWTGQALENLTVAGTALGVIEVPGQVEAYRMGPSSVRLLSPDLRLDLRGGNRLALVADLDGGGILFQPAADTDLGRGPGGVQLQAGPVHGSAHGPDLDLQNGTLHARDHLVLVAGAASPAQEARWQQPAEDQTLPYRFEGRYLSFVLNERGLHDLVVHGLPLGQVDLPGNATPTIDEDGARLEVEGTGTHLRVVDAPATRLWLTADQLSADLPNETTLPNGGVVSTTANDTRVELRVSPPRSSSVPAEPGNLVPTEPLAGHPSGLRTRGPDQLQVQATHPGALYASYLARDGQGIDLGIELVRALLVEDVDGDGRVGIGEPALAQRVLDEGVTVEEDDRVVSTFSLWSGNLTVVAELREGQVKVTYEVEDLSPPPGTLFVLESRTVAPNGSAVSATDEGVVVRNGTTEARFVAAGPVEVDGEPAWARHSVLLEDDGQARVLVTYPAGDHVVHDPTVTVQSLPVVTQELFSAGPWSVAVGALAGLAMVVYGVRQRDRRRP